MAKMSNRTFGVEIELFGLTKSQVQSILENIGVSVFVGSCIERGLPGVWKITSDSSVVDADGTLGSGIEVVSPVLKGQNGLNQLRKVAAALEAHGARVNRTCGLHVHVGAKGLTPLHIQCILNRYSMMEEVIDSMMPRSRRGNDNHYCQSIRSLMSQDCSGLLSRRWASLEEMARSISRRYYKINLAAYLRHGTIEFRHHSGTVNPNKIVNWVLFCLNFVTTSKPKASTIRSMARPAQKRGRKAGKRHEGLIKVMQALLDNTACATATLANITGYSESSIPAVISEIRRTFRVKIVKRAGLYRFDVFVNRSEVRDMIARERNNSALTSAANLPVFENDSPFRGLPPEVVAFYQERIEELA
jgi:hypothetical protein